MIYAGNSEENFTIDDLIEALQKARKDLGGDAFVTLEDSSGEIRGIQAIASNYALDIGSGVFEWTGNPDEDENDGNPIICTIYSELKCF